MPNTPQNRRAKNLVRLVDEAFDILIIGGGVTGAGVALDAVSRGFKVALIEMQDFASGSSSRSTKLIHGGLRYLKQMQFKLVYQTGRERSIAHKIAPFLVHPERMMIPVVEGGSLSINSAALALNIYDRLAGVAPEQRKKRLNAPTALEMEPMLPSDRLKGALVYSEYRTDDARLTIELLKKADSMGAFCLNYVKASEFIEENGALIRVKAKDQLSGAELKIKANHFINATGVWTDSVWNLGEVQRKKVLLPSKGVHIVVTRSRLPLAHAVYFDAPDSRMIFAIPRSETTYVGTTDDSYDGDLSNPQMNSFDRDYLLSAINKFFNIEPLTENDIISHWVGIRPLIMDGKKKAGEVSRRDEVFESENGLISITGGKLTGYRLMARKVVDRICKRDGTKRRCVTKSLTLGEKPFKSYSTVEDLIEFITKANNKVDTSLATYLVHNYGWAAVEIIASVAVHSDDFRKDLARTELKYTIEHEFVETWEDFSVRRSGWRYFHPQWEKAYRELWNEME